MIVDASVAFKWLVTEDGSSEAIALLAEDNIQAPSWLVMEVGNALWKRIARGEMNDPEGAIEQIARLPDMVFLVDGKSLASDALRIACELKHPLYDCLYLALAENQDDILVTADQRFLAKARGTRFEPLVRPLAGGATE